MQIRGEVFYRFGLIISSLGGLHGIYSAIVNYFLIRKLQAHLNVNPISIETSNFIYGTVHSITILSIIFNLIILSVSIEVYSLWSNLKEREKARKATILIIALLVLTIFCSNFFSLIGLLIALFGILMLHPTLELREQISTKEVKKGIKEEKIVDIKAAYEKLLDLYRITYGVRIAEKKLENDIEALTLKGFSREDAIKLLYRKCFK